MARWRPAAAVHLKRELLGRSAATANRLERGEWAFGCARGPRRSVDWRVFRESGARRAAEVRADRQRLVARQAVRVLARADLLARADWLARALAAHRDRVPWALRTALERSGRLVGGRRKPVDRRVGVTATRGRRRWQRTGRRPGAGRRLRRAAGVKSAQS